MGERKVREEGSMETKQETPNAERTVEPIDLGGPPEEPRTSLQDYEAVKFELAGLIREASSAAWQDKREGLQRDFHSLLKRLAEDRFYLTLAGQFSRGKTTLLNAMLGTDRLPTGVVPVTSVITAVSYNTRERVLMHFENTNLTHEVPLAELREWITEGGNPGNERKIDLAEVQLPAEMLRRGAFFVDTPGLGSAIIENTETTQRFLPHIDALVLVTSFEFPLSQEEILFVRRARELHRKTFVAINKLDLCTERQRQEVLDFIRGRIVEETGVDQISLFAVSASEALAAKLERQSDRLERSGLPVLERALVEYLITDRSRDFLAAMFDRIESLLRFHEVPGLRELEDRLEGIRDQVYGREQLEKSTPRLGPEVIREMNAERTTRISSCFVCKRMGNATFKFMSRLQYDLSHSREQQVLHASRSGFCGLHSREYARLASPQGIASGYPKTLLFVAEHLQSLSKEGRLSDDWKDQFEEFLPGSDKCPACEAIAKTESEVMNRFVHEHQDVARDSDVRFPCVCLRHLEAIIERAPQSELANRMVLQSTVALKRTAENMQRFALRHGGSHMELVAEEELRSPETGLNLLVGQPNVRPVGRS
jgi:GTP-binding protein EngB required for normal cell division